MVETGKKNYKTAQGQAVQNYLKELGGAHATVKDVVLYMQKIGMPIGTTTVYRHLEKMEKLGLVRRYVLDDQTGACFAYCSKENANERHFHLKCECCGTLIHLQCSYLKKVQEHIMEDHQFSINETKTVFYGRCEHCQR